jgi:putative chitinase
MNLSIDLLTRATGCTAAHAARVVGDLEATCRTFSIDTAARLAAFLAQVGHESGSFAHLREIWGPTPAQQRYEGRADLGNVQPGDGSRYRGRGLIQVTGRANYRTATQRLRVLLGALEVPDFEQTPEALEQPRWACLSAGEYWHRNGLNALADSGRPEDFERITRRINGGLNGQADRLDRWARARQALADWMPGPAPGQATPKPPVPPAAAAPAVPPAPPPAATPTPTPTAPPAPAKETPMAPLPLIKALLPALVQQLPRLGKLFGSGSAVQERNVQAAGMALDVVQTAIGARNAQEAVELVATDPQARQRAAEAIDAAWWQLGEAGGGGIEGARGADRNFAAGADWWRSPSLIVAVLLLPLVYLLVLSLVGVLGNATWSDEVRSSLAGLIVGTILGGLMGYYFGQTTSRNRTPLPAKDSHE